MKITDLLETEFLTDKDNIIEWISKSFIGFELDKLIIETDGLVYDGILTLRKDVERLKVQFKSVTGYFKCGRDITSLVGCPSYIGDYFSCNQTKITSLEGCPESVKRYFFCRETMITSLKYCPKSVGEEFWCGNNKIIDPKEYRYALYCEIGNKFISNNTKIDEIINTYGGADNRKHWAMAINLLSKVEL